MISSIRLAHQYALADGMKNRSDFSTLGGYYQCPSLRAAGPWIRAVDLTAIRGRKDYLNSVATANAGFTGYWIWNGDDADKGKRLWTTDEAGGVNVFRKLNGTTTWTVPTISTGSPGTLIKRNHWDEMRLFLKYFGRCSLMCGTHSGNPGNGPLTFWYQQNSSPQSADTCFTQSSANGCSTCAAWGGYPAYEVQTMTYCPAYFPGATILPASSMRIFSYGYARTIEVRYVKRPAYMPTWNSYRSGMAWDSPGGHGENDSVLLGTIACPAAQNSGDVYGELSGEGLAAAIQAMVDNTYGQGCQWFMFRDATGPNQGAFVGVHWYVELEMRDMEWEM
jgi:hypothetical protein